MVAKDLWTNDQPKKMGRKFWAVEGLLLSFNVGWDEPTYKGLCVNMIAVNDQFECYSLLLIGLAFKPV